MKTFLARQPIFDSDNSVIGYEMLFRNSKDNQAIVMDDYSATVKVMMDILLNFGVSQVTNDKRFFIKLNEDLILQDAPDLFKPEELIIELKADEILGEEALNKLSYYKNKGYLIAISNFEPLSYMVSLLEMADIVKVSFYRKTQEELQGVLKVLGPYKKRVLADKVESNELFEVGKDLGFQMFQGYYFSRPTVLEATTNESIPSVYYELLDELDGNVMDFNRLSDIIEKDTTLTFSILKLLNSAAYYGNSRVISVKDALVKLGATNIKQLVLMSMIKNLSANDTPSELIRLTLRRGKQAERLAKCYGLESRKGELFLLGILSLINVIMRRDMNEIVSNLPLNEDLSNALRGESNDLSKVLDLIILAEMDATESVEAEIKKWNISHETFNDIYMEAVTWADKIID